MEEGGGKEVDKEQEGARKDEGLESSKDLEDLESKTMASPSDKRYQSTPLQRKLSTGNTDITRTSGNFGYEIPILFEENADQGEELKTFKQPQLHISLSHVLRTKKKQPQAFDLSSSSEEEEEAPKPVLTYPNRPIAPLLTIKSGSGKIVRKDPSKRISRKDTSKRITRKRLGGAGVRAQLEMYPIQRSSTDDTSEDSTNEEILISSDDETSTPKVKKREDYIDESSKAKLEEIKKTNAKYFKGGPVF